MYEHLKKMIAPIIVTVITLLYYVGFAVLLMLVALPAIVKIIGAFLSLVLAVVSIYVVVERIKEIRSGEEDDLSKY